MLDVLEIPGAADRMTDRHDFASALREMSDYGTARRRRSSDPAYMARLAEAASFMADVLEGRRRYWQLEEALSTSDFPILFGDILDRQLLGNYTAYAATYRNYASIGSVRDFRQARRLAYDGLDGRLYPSYLKPEGDGVQEDNKLTETGYLTSVQVYEKGIGINWRAMINDDLDVFGSIPSRLALSARRTEEYFAATQFVDANGPHASLYTSGNHNIVNQTNGASTNNPALSINGLSDALIVLANQTINGEPVVVDHVELVVPTALMVAAQNILHATMVEMNVNGGNIVGLANTLGQENRLIVQNWISNGIRLSVNPYITTIASSANGKTSWWLFANPNEARPAFEVTFLRGYEQPGLYQKAPNTQRIGGAIDPLLGDFDTMEQRFKVMHIIGGTQLDGRSSVASNGSGA